MFAIFQDELEARISLILAFFSQLIGQLNILQSVFFFLVAVRKTF